MLLVEVELEPQGDELQGEDVVLVPVIALDRVCLHHARPVLQGQLLEVVECAPRTVDPCATRARGLALWEQAHLPRHVQGGDPQHAFLLVAVGGAHRHGKLACMVCPDGLQALALLDQGDDDAVHGIKLQSAGADSGARFREAGLVEGVGIACVVAILREVAIRALAAILRAHVGPALRVRALPSLEVGTVLSAVPGPARLAGGEMRRAPIAGSSAALAITVMDAAR